MSSRKPPSQRNSEYVTHRMNRALQSMSPGTMGGRVANAAPLPKAAAQDSSSAGLRELVFSFSGHLTMAASPPYTFAAADSPSINTFDCTLGTAGTANAIIDLMKNGAVIATATIPAYTTYVSVDVDVACAGLDVLNVRVTNPGAGGIDLTARVSLQ